MEKYSEENGLDKYLVYAVIKAESNFNPNVKSNADARGLMQLMEETAVERSNVIENEDIEAYDLYDPETNIKLGTSYLSYLLELYDGNTVLAIIAYNAGLGNVQQWIQDGIIKQDGSDIENIPYQEGNDNLYTYDYIYAKKEENPQVLPLIINIHGGAFCGGDKSVNKYYGAFLAKYHYQVATLNYHYAPEGNLKKQIQDFLHISKC